MDVYNEWLDRMLIVFGMFGFLWMFLKFWFFFMWCCKVIMSENEKKYGFCFDFINIYELMLLFFCVL